VRQTPFAILDFGQVQVQIQVRPITADGLRTYLSGETLRIKERVAQRDAVAPRKAVVIVDGSVSLMPPSDARKLQAEWFRDNQDLLRLVMHRMGFVLPNPLLRGFMSAVFFLAAPPVPMVTHRSLQEALDWALDQARAIDGQVSDELLRDGIEAVERARRRVTGGAF